LAAGKAVEIDADAIGTEAGAGAGLADAATGESAIPAPVRRARAAPRTERRVIVDVRVVVMDDAFSCSPSTAYRVS
jgi:hypothetical protein